MSRLFCDGKFFGLLKKEIYYSVVYYSCEELKSEIDHFYKILQWEMNKRKVRMDESCSI